MQTIIVIIVVCLAVAYIVKTFIRKSGSEDKCSCGCTSCPTADTCHDKEPTEK